MGFLLSSLYRMIQGPGFTAKIDPGLSSSGEIRPQDFRLFSSLVALLLFAEEPLRNKPYITLMRKHICICWVVLKQIVASIEGMRWHHAS